MRAMVLLPTATLPARPMTNGAATDSPRKVAVARWSSRVAPTDRFSRRETGRYTSETSSRETASLTPRSAARSSSVSVSGVLARSRAQAARSNSAYPVARSARRVGSVAGCTGPLSGPAGRRQRAVTIRFRPASFA